jgi:hypothetical protein
MTTTPSILIIDGITIKSLPAKMLEGQDERIRQATGTTITNLSAGRGLRLEEIVRIFRGNAFVGVSKKNLDGLVASWVSVWQKHGRF